ncbi:hypothetical protein J2S90_002483 [Arthrobacter bambusae]|uniref:Uncharacterized protein n=1 Tax=Arthrobacter bambusae TaxID=1338426 RepID=A0AAW8DAZ9_9MICC|nr:hypothetical protein [Arthrobacter bambusae]MDQ0127406.1 hypothetical protein [Arthrobacter bambusae]MDQ0178748.1 hypothetical protein [Arthrobacter bambusae]
MPTTTSRIVVQVEDRSSLDRQLEQTSALLRRVATNCGILVTRFDHTTFEVAFSPEVPFGLTRELDLLCLRAGIVRVPHIPFNHLRPCLGSAERTVS